MPLLLIVRSAGTVAFFFLPGRYPVLTKQAPGGWNLQHPIYCRKERMEGKGSAHIHGSAVNKFNDSQWLLLRIQGVKYFHLPEVNDFSPAFFFCILYYIDRFVYDAT